MKKIIIFILSLTMFYGCVDSGKSSVNETVISTNKSDDSAYFESNDVEQSQTIVEQIDEFVEDADDFIETIHLTNGLFYGFIFLIPYLIIVLSSDLRENYWVFIPVVAHCLGYIIGIMIILSLPIILTKKSMELYYKRAIKNEIDTKYIKEIDPYDEEDWNERWKDKIQENKLYKLINKIL